MKKKILFFITTLNGGGAERLLRDLVNHMDASKFDITVQTFYDTGIYRAQMNSHIHYKTIVSLKNDFLRRLKGRILWSYVSPKYIYKKYVSGDYDYEVAFLEGIVTKIMGSSDSSAHLIAWVHAGLYNNFQTKQIFRSLESQKKAYKNFEKIVCVSKSARDEFIQRFGNYDSLCVKYNFINRKMILSKAGEVVESISHEKVFRMITLGRLSFQKGYDRLISVVKDLVNEGIKCELWIFGKGECRKEYENYILKNNLSAYIKLWGFHENPYKFMKYCDLFVCSSRSEGYNLAIAEAMTLGMPILSTHCAGPDELLSHGKYGMLVKNSKEGLYKGIKAFYSSPEKLQFYAQASKERVEFFDMHMRIKEIENLFK